MAETAPKTARNWRKDRFRKYTRPLPYPVKSEPNRGPSSTQRRRGAEISAENHKKTPMKSKTKWREGAGFASRSCSSLRLSLRLCVSALNSPFRFSRDASHADQVSENDAFQGL